MKAVVTVKAVSLGGDHPDYKLFFAPPAAPEYAELYLELLEGGNRVSISEKDPDYRGAVIKAFANE
jgi:hypothetical protein